MKDVLLVEDHVELAELMTAFLQKEGCSVHHVTSGEEAIDYLQGQQVKVLLLDIMLPGMDGFAVWPRRERKRKCADFDPQRQRGEGG